MSLYEQLSREGLHQRLSSRADGETDIRLTGTSADVRSPHSESVQRRLIVQRELWGSVVWPYRVKRWWRESELGKTVRTACPGAVPLFALFVLTFIWRSYAELAARVGAEDAAILLAFQWLAIGTLTALFVWLVRSVTR